MAKDKTQKPASESRDTETIHAMGDSVEHITLCGASIFRKGQDALQATDSIEEARLGEELRKAAKAVDPFVDVPESVPNTLTINLSKTSRYDLMRYTMMLMGLALGGKLADARMDELERDFPDLAHGLKGYLDNLKDHFNKHTNTTGDGPVAPPEPPEPDILAWVPGNLRQRAVATVRAKIIADIEAEAKGIVGKVRVKDSEKLDALLLKALEQLTFEQPHPLQGSLRPDLEAPIKFDIRKADIFHARDVFSATPDDKVGIDRQRVEMAELKQPMAPTFKEMTEEPPRSPEMAKRDKLMDALHDEVVAAGLSVNPLGNPPGTPQPSLQDCADMAARAMEKANVLPEAVQWHEFRTEYRIPLFGEHELKMIYDNPRSTAGLVGFEGMWAREPFLFGSEYWQEYLRNCHELARIKEPFDIFKAAIEAAVKAIQSKHAEHMREEHHG